jgi:hypothetical protein
MKVDETTFSKFRVHGGKIDWEEYLTEESNYNKIQGLRREWRETHWRARNPDAEEDPPTHKWFTFGQGVDPMTVRASPPELSDDERGELNIRQGKPKQSGPLAGTAKTAGRIKRKRATGPRSKMSNSRRDGALASSSSCSPASASASSSSFSSSRKEGLTDSESSREKVGQGRKKRRRFD